MKKFLSLLAAVGLTATASASVVACSSVSNKSISVKKADLSDNEKMLDALNTAYDFQGKNTNIDDKAVSAQASWISSTQLAFSGVKTKAVSDITKSASTDAGSEVTGYSLFDKDGNAIASTDATVKVMLHSPLTEDVKKGKTFEADLVITFTKDQSKAEETTYYINSTTASKGKKGDATKLKVPAYTEPSATGTPVKADQEEVSKILIPMVVYNGVYKFASFEDIAKDNTVTSSANVSIVMVRIIDVINLINSDNGLLLEKGPKDADGNPLMDGVDFEPTTIPAQKDGKATVMDLFDHSGTNLNKLNLDNLAAVNKFIDNAEAYLKSNDTTSDKVVTATSDSDVTATVNEIKTMNTSLSELKGKKINLTVNITND